MTNASPPTDPATFTTFNEAYTASRTALRNGSMQEARVCAERAYAFAVADGNAIERVDALCMLGRAHSTMGQYAEAERALAEALEYAHDSADRLAFVHMHTGVIRWQQGQMKTARSLLESAQTTLKRLGEVNERLTTLINLGIVVYTEGEYQRALTVFTEAIELATSLNELSRLSIAQNNLGQCYCDLGANAQAQTLFQAAITNATTSQAIALLGDAERNLGRALAQDGHFDAALTHIEQALTLARTYHRQYIERQVLATLAEVHLMRQDPTAALDLAQRLLDLAGDVPTARAEARLIFGLASLAQGDSLHAMLMLEEGLLDAEATFSKVLSLRFHAALAQLVEHPAIADIHRRIAREQVEQILDALADKALQAAFRATPLVRGVLR